MDFDQDLFADDEETWKLLVTSHDVEARLPSLRARLEEDAGIDNIFWDQQLISSIKTLGFDIVSNNVEETTPQQNVSIEAFTTEKGRAHIKATTALLRVTEKIAVQLTLGALKSLAAHAAKQEDTTNLGHLLGTLSLLKTVIAYHHQQRLARQRIIAEFLRMEGETAYHELVSYLDSKYLINGEPRGLMRLLITTACHPEAPPTRQELLPSRELLGSDSAWNSFASECIQNARVQARQERVEAMEALLVLFYDRLIGGVRRVDYAILLTALQYSVFFTNQEPQLCHLSALTCAEAMGLWRPFEETASPWVLQHPLLHDTSTHQAQAELKTIKTLLMEVSVQVMERRKRFYEKGQHVTSTSDGAVEAPESIALLTFGLLMQLVPSPPDGFREDISAGKCIEVANDQCGAFSYLDAVMKSLVRAEGSETTNAAVVAYASIGQEVVAATVSAFSNTLGRRENVEMLCNLAAVTYQNIPVLCERFWVEWEAYGVDAAQEQSNTCNKPLCLLLDAAYAITTTAISKGASNGDIEVETILVCFSPLLVLVSSLCSDSNMMQFVLRDVFPEGFLRIAVVCCYRICINADAAMSSQLAPVVKAIATLTRVLDSTAARTLLGRSLLGNDDAVNGGSCLLYQVAVRSNHPAIATASLNAIANVLMDGNGNGNGIELALILTKHISLNHIAAFVQAKHEELTLSTIRVLHALSMNMIDVLFDKTVLDEVKRKFLRVVAESVDVAGEFLSKYSEWMVSGEMGTATKRTVLHCLQIIQCFLEALWPLMNLPIVSENIQLDARNMRNAFLQKLVTPNSVLGKAIIIYATYPISSSIARVTGSFLREATALNLASNTEIEDPHKYGAWSELINDSALTEAVPARCRAHIRDLLNQVGDLELNEEDLPTTQSAMHVLQYWGMHAETMYSEKSFIGISLLSIGPCGLLLSPSTAPPEVRKNMDLSSVWPTDLLLNTKLLITYVDRGSVVAMNILDMCLRHASLREMPKMIEAMGGMEQLQRLFLQSVSRENQGDDVVSNSLGILGFISILMEKFPASETSLSDNFVLKIFNIVGDVAEIMEKETNTYSLLQNDEIFLSKIQLASGCLDIFSMLQKMQRENATIMNLTRQLCSIVSKSRSLLTSNDDVETDHLFLLRTASAFELCSKALNLISVMIAEDSSERDKLKRFWSDAHIRDMEDVIGDLEVPSQFDASWKEVQTSLAEFPNISQEMIASSFPSYKQGTSFSGNSWCNTSHGARVLKLHKELSFCDASMSCMSSQLAHLKSWTRFARLQLILRKGNASMAATVTSPAAATGALVQCTDEEDVVRSALLQAQTGLLDLKKVAAGVLTTESPSVDHATSDFFIEGAFMLSDLLLVSLQEGLSSPHSYALINPDSFFVMLQDLVDASNNIFKLIRYTNADDSGTTMRIVLRHRLLTSAFLCFRQISRLDVDFNSAPAAAVRQYREIQRGFLGLACESLILIEPKEFDAEVSRCMGYLDADQCFELVCTSFSLVQAMVPSDVRGCDEYASLLHKHNIMRSIAQHLKSASAIAASEYGLISTAKDGEKTDGKTGTRDKAKYERAIRVVESGYNFALAITEAGSYATEMLSLLFENNFVRAITDNPLFVRAASISRPADGPADKDDKSCRFRGYLPMAGKQAYALQFAQSSAVGGRKERTKLYKADEAQSLWRLHIRFLTSLVKSSRTAVVKEKRLKQHRSAALHLQCVNMATIFLGAHDEILQASLKSCSAAIESVDRGEMGMDIPMTGDTSVKSLLSLTEFGLEEASEIFALLSELCTGANLNHYERFNRELRSRYLKSTRRLVASLSCFLGSAGTARELLAALERADSLYTDVTSGELGQSLVLSEHKNMNLHPLLYEGIPNARHEAIQHAHYVSSCCIALTEEDVKRREIKPDLSVQSSTSGIDSWKAAERSFHAHVNNAFTLRIENLVCHCLSSALSVLLKTHPSSSAFVLFSEEEVKHLNFTTIVNPGTIIAVWGEKSGKDMHFARVLHTHHMQQSWSVEYLNSVPSGGPMQSERTVRFDRLAGIEDKSKRQWVTSFEPAPDLLEELEPFPLKDLSLGHIILVLRWCRQQSCVLTTAAADEAHCSMQQIRRLAEYASFFVGVEISVQEVEGAHFEPLYGMKLRKQLLDLFDDNSAGRMPSPSAGGFERSTPERVRPHLGSLIDDEDAWSTFLKQLQRTLDTARKEERDTRRRGIEKGVGSLSPLMRGLVRGSSFRNVSFSLQ